MTSRDFPPLTRPATSNRLVQCALCVGGQQLHPHFALFFLIAVSRELSSELSCISACAAGRERAPRHSRQPNVHLSMSGLALSSQRARFHLLSELAARLEPFLSIIVLSCVLYFHFCCYTSSEENSSRGYSGFMKCNRFITQANCARCLDDALASNFLIHLLFSWARANYHIFFICHSAHAAIILLNYGHCYLTIAFFLLLSKRIAI
jgi:hypothetical protein